MERCDQGPFLWFFNIGIHRNSRQALPAKLSFQLSSSQRGSCLATKLCVTYLGIGLYFCRIAAQRSCKRNHNQYYRDHEILGLGVGWWSALRRIPDILGSSAKDDEQITVCKHASVRGTMKNSESHLKCDLCTASVMNQAEFTWCYCPDSGTLPKFFQVFKETSHALFV
jgi:hypothetical protein